MEKENLDNLFRESLDEFSQTPDPKVWDRIQASLDKKARRRRRVVPLWWQLGGAAAALALLLFLLIPGAEEGALPQTEPISTTPSVNTPIEESKEVLDNDSQRFEEAVATQQTDETTVPAQNDGPSQLNTKKFETSVASQNNTVQPSETYESSANALTQSTPPIPPQGNEGIAVQAEEKNPVIDTGAVAAESPTTETQSPTETMALAEAEEKKALEELLSGPEDEVISKPDDSEGKWAIGPSIAPVYFNGLGDGSPIDQAFVSNEKSGSFNMSYGLQVSYQVNKRLQLRSGLHKVDFGYNTNDIVFSSALQASTATQMKNVDYSPSAEYLVVNNQRTELTKADSGVRNEIAARNTSRAGTMVQEFGYLEVPFELNYALVDRTIGVNLISGISSLFLVDNAVSLESESGTTDVGQANNLNDVNFSANFGLGVEYQVSDKIKLQVEPLLKYQLNTFSDTAGDFRPYSIGIYSGIRYKF